MMMLPVHFLMVRGEGGEKRLRAASFLLGGRRRACLSQRRGASFLLATVSGHLSAKSFFILPQFPYYSIRASRASFALLLQVTVYG